MLIEPWAPRIHSWTPEEGQQSGEGDDEAGHAEPVVHQRVEQPDQGAGTDGRHERYGRAAKPLSTNNVATDRGRRARSPSRSRGRSRPSSSMNTTPRAITPTVETALQGEVHQVRTGEEDRGSGSGRSSRSRRSPMMTGQECPGPRRLEAVHPARVPSRTEALPGSGAARRGGPSSTDAPGGGFSGRCSGHAVTPSRSSRRARTGCRHRMPSLWVRRCSWVRHRWWGQTTPRAPLRAALGSRLDDRWVTALSLAPVIAGDEVLGGHLAHG